MKIKIITIALTILAFTAVAKNNYYANPKEPSARLLLNPNKTTKALFPVTLLSINGQEVAHKNDSIWLKPGTYKLTFSAQIDHNYAGGNGLNIRRSSVRHGRLNNDLKITVEANKNYHIGYDAKDINHEKWLPIVWKEN